MGADRHADWVALAGDVLFWAYVGLLVVVVVELARGSARTSDAARARTAPR